MGKPPDLPWVVIPLIIGGDLYGQIVADNAKSRDEIEEQVLPYLTLSARLHRSKCAARAIDLLKLRRLDLLYYRLGLGMTWPKLLQRFLIYLTDGQTLGFTRAVFFRVAGGESPSLVFEDGLGPITRDEFLRIQQGIATDRLNVDANMERAGTLRDSALASAAL